MDATRRAKLTTITVALLAVSPMAGCSVPGSLFGRSAQQQSLHKQVEADPFPTAKQVGLQQKTS
ncbi:MAG: hypothetical protein LLG00_07105 [Planctomycetaceae bacterium]|nr:hypothetical protein [Planctomycetaceae bacterium]